MPQHRPRLSIRHRLFVLGLVPLLALLTIGGMNLGERLTDRQSARQLVGLVDLATRVTDVAHALQIERGMTGT
ncbi:hypothetical protein [Mobilicoccus sp.]|nr:hypothetical protein [Mobilicoccus sp.]